MPSLNSATGVFAGSQEAVRVYLGDTMAWEAGEPADPQIVWTEDWESWPLGIPSVSAPISQVDGSPSIVAGKSLQTGPSGTGCRFSVSGMSHWSLEFTVVMAGTQTTNHFIASLRDGSGTYVADLNVRNGEKQLWNRLNFGADATGKSTWTYVGTGPSTLRLIYEWWDDEYVKCHMFYGANLAGATPDQTLVYDKTMSGGILVGKRIGAVRLGNDGSDGITQTFDDLVLRDLTL